MNDIFENTETMQESEHPRFYTAESVMRGHPDKLCDLIADSVLDECLKHDPASRVACEVLDRKVLLTGIDHGSCNFLCNRCLLIDGCHLWISDFLYVRDCRTVVDG